MANCEKCWRKLYEGNVSEHESFCIKCYSPENLEEHKLKAVQEEQRRKTRRYLDDVLLTTETAPNLKIVKRLEIVTAECAFGMNMFKDLFAGVRNVVGGRSEAVQQTMRDSRRVALRELKKKHMQSGPMPL